MEFGMFHEFLRAPGQSEAEAFDRAFEIVDAAEEHGLDAMWIAELHVAPERSVASAPLTLAAAIAQRTKRMKIGTAVQVLPLCHPLQLAEEVTTVDHLSRGRLIFGVGRSGFPRTYEAFGVPYAESRERFQETLEILKKAFTQDRFSHEGRWYSFKNVALVPKPYQKPWPEIRVAATSADTFPANGAAGHAIFCAVRFGTLSELGPNLRAYQDAWHEAGHPGKGKSFLRVPVYVAATEDAARTEPEASIMEFYRVLGARIEESATLDGARPEEQRAERGARLQAITWDEVLRDKIIVGTPEQVAARINGLRDELGLNGILAELNCGSRISHAKVLESLRLLCRDVMPRVRQSV